MAAAVSDWPATFHNLVSGRARGIGPTLARLGLWAASGPYGLAIRARNGLYDCGWKHTSRAAVPVVSVGNLTLGGTGKTPCVEYVARFYRERNVRVAIVSRGYGSTGGANDEAMVLEENLADVPHLQGPDRIQMCEAAVEELEAELVILDDGFQHRRLARDLDVVLIDATNPWGHGYLVPRGLLRESPAALKRAAIVLLSRCDQVPDTEVEALVNRILRYCPNAPVARSVHAPIEWLQHETSPRPIGALNGRTVAAFCGLGNPEAFRRSLVACGCEIAAFRTYPDHHAYTRADVDGLRAWARSQQSGAAIVTTQKDLVKLRIATLGERELLALRIGLTIESGPAADEFHRRLAALAPS